MLKKMTMFMVTAIAVGVLSGCDDLKSPEEKRGYTIQAGEVISVTKKKGAYQDVSKDNYVVEIIYNLKSNGNKCKLNKSGVLEKDHILVSNAKEYKKGDRVSVLISKDTKELDSVLPKSKESEESCKKSNTP